jgi:hypothetical protein
MATRVILFHPDGHALYGIDGHHGDAHIAAWIDETVRQVRARFGLELVAVEYDPLASGQATRDLIGRALHELRLDTHVRPSGEAEVSGITQVRPGRTVEGVGVMHERMPAARAVRVLQAPFAVAGGTCCIHNRRRGLGELAHDWRMSCDAAYRRAHERVERAQER